MVKTHFKPMLHLWRNQVFGFTSKICKKHLWNSEILSKDAGLWKKLFSPSMITKALILAMSTCSCSANGSFIISYTSLNLSPFFSIFQTLAFPFPNDADIVSHPEACTKRTCFLNDSCLRWCYHLTLSNKKSTSQWCLCWQQ